MEQKWPQDIWLVRHGQSSGNVARAAAEAEPLQDFGGHLLGMHFGKSQRANASRPQVREQQAQKVAELEAKRK